MSTEEIVRLPRLLLRQLRTDIALAHKVIKEIHAQQPIFHFSLERFGAQIKEIDKALANGGCITMRLAEELRDDLVKAWEGSAGEFRRKYWRQLSRFDRWTGNRVDNEE